MAPLLSPPLCSSNAQVNFLISYQTLHSKSTRCAKQASIITRMSVNIVRKTFLKKIRFPYFSFSRNFHSRDFQHCILVSRFPLPRFQRPRTLFALIFLPKLIHAAERIACDNWPTCSKMIQYTTLQCVISGKVGPNGKGLTVLGTPRFHSCHNYCSWPVRPQISFAPRSKYFCTLMASYVLLRGRKC